MSLHEAISMARTAQHGLLCALVMYLLLAPMSTAHEQATMVVVITNEGVAPGNISDPNFLHGNALEFVMKDTTNNTTARVHIDLDGDGLYETGTDASSGELVESCELDENGSLVDPDCAVSYTFSFDTTSTTAGNHTYWVIRTTNGTATTVQHWVIVHGDEHEGNETEQGAACEAPPCTDGDDAASGSADDASTRESLLTLLLIVAGLGAFFTTLSILKERQTTKILEEE